MLDQILNITEQNLDDAQTQKQILNNDRLKPALFSVLCEIKERTVLSLRNMQDPNPPNPDLMRLDNMLIAEEIVEGNVPQNRIQDQTTIENAEYKNKLGQIQRIYKQEIEKINQGMGEHIFLILPFRFFQFLGTLSTKIVPNFSSPQHRILLGAK